MKVLQFLLLSAAAVVLSGCQKQTGPETSGPDGKGPAITLEGRVAPDSKVSDTSFDNGDEIGLTVVGWSGEEPAALSDYRDEDNVRYVYEDGLFSALSTACYPNSEDKVTLWAYYPFTYGGGFVPGSDELHVRVLASQDNEGDFKASDYLVAEASGISPSDAAVPMEFRHILAKVRLNVVLDGASEEKVSAVMPYVAASAVYDMTEGTLSSLADHCEIAMFPVSSLCVEAIIVPQTVKAGDYLFYITVGERTFTYAAAEDMVFAAGTINEFRALVSQDASVKSTVPVLSRSNTCIW